MGKIGKTRIKENLIGKKFGRLTVISRGPNSKNRSARWYCQCDCGNPKLSLVRGYELTHGIVKSCGCLQKEITAVLSKERNKKHNIIDTTSAEYAIGYTSKGEPFWFDKEDFQIVSQYCWHYNKQGYVVTTNPVTKKAMFLHHLVMGISKIKKGYYVDHINHQPRYEHKIDNRKQNLRIVTPSQNTMNSNIRSNNKTKVTGVYYDKSRKKWKANIKINYKTISLGRFDNFENAVIARKKAEKEYFGEYAFKTDELQQKINNIKEDHHD